MFHLIRRQHTSLYAQHIHIHSIYTVAQSSGKLLCKSMLKPAYCGSPDGSHPEGQGCRWMISGLLTNNSEF